MSIERSFFLFFSWKTAEKLFLDAMDKIKAIGNEVSTICFERLTFYYFFIKSMHEDCAFC